MNVVWPITALFGTTWILWQYFSYERLARYDKSHAAIGRNGEPSTEQRALLPIIVANGALHCGSGCALGDLCAEWLAFGLPTVAMTLGWQRLFPDKIFAAWILDYVLAYAFGVVFKYFTIRPMRGLSFSAGMIAAMKADTFSLTPWQFGMYGFMAIAYLQFSAANLAPSWTSIVLSSGS